MIKKRVINLKCLLGIHDYREMMLPNGRTALACIRCLKEIHWKYY